MDRPRDQSGLLEIVESRGQRRRADRAEPASKLVESDVPLIGDEAQETQRVAAPHDLGQRRGRAQAITGGELRAAAAGRCRPRLPGAPALSTSRMAATIRGAALAVSMLRQVGLELVEKPPATFLHPQHGQAVACASLSPAAARPSPPPPAAAAWRAPLGCIVDEANDVGGSHVRAEPFPEKPEHDLQDLVTPLELVQRVGRARPSATSRSTCASAASTAARTRGVNSVVSSSTSAGSQPTMKTSAGSEPRAFATASARDGTARCRSTSPVASTDSTRTTYTVPGDRPAASRRR